MLALRLALLQAWACALLVGAVRERHLLGASASASLDARAASRALKDEPIVKRVLEFVPAPVQVVSATDSPVALLWQGADRPSFILHRHTGRIVDVKFFPSGNRVLTTGADGLSVVWSALTGGELVAMRSSPNWERFLESQIFPDGDRVVTLVMDMTAVVWSANTGEVLHLLNLSDVGQHRLVRISSRGDRIVTGASYGTEDPAVIWDADSGRELHRLMQSDEMVRFLELSGDGSKAVTAGYESSFIWDVYSGAKLHSFPGRWINGVTVSHTGDKIAVSSLRGKVFIWNGITGQMGKVFTLGADRVEARLLAGGDRMVTFRKKEAAIWDTSSGEQLTTFEGVPDDELGCTASSPSGDIIAACASSASWRGEQWTMVWEASTGQRLSRFQTEKAWATAEGILSGGRAPCSLAVSHSGSLSGWLVTV